MIDQEKLTGIIGQIMELAYDSGLNIYQGKTMTFDMVKDGRQLGKWQIKIELIEPAEDAVTLTAGEIDELRKGNIQ